MRPFAMAVAFASIWLAVPKSGQAQQDQPETHIITVTTFEVPFGEELGKFWEVVDKYIIPSDKANPNVLSERLASHNWGDAKKTIWFITEYKDMAGVQAAEQFSNKYFDEHYPEGSAGRDSADAAFNEHFLKHFGGHEDNILTANMKRAK
jgi:hypothetical protein